MKVEVVYALPAAAEVVSLDLPAGASVRDALAASGLRIDLEKSECGVFGKRVPLSQRLSDGDRVEIYRALAMDPKEARRRRAKARTAKR
jgi:putative ubiquitin-RnfH superfamily antitoxin RatB of RatAB toxin-antitoxin module